MRLLNTQTIQLESFNPSDVPRYAILSHTWGSSEVLYHDVHDKDDRPKNTQGWVKLRESCAIAAELGYTYIWIDTCCIDKSSSAELSEAINSMFRWYAESDICIAFLEDVTVSGLAQSQQEFMPPASLISEFRRSRWFTRGWTLQELIAPRNVFFYGRMSAPFISGHDFAPSGSHASFARFGTRAELAETLHKSTGIDLEILRSGAAGLTDGDLGRSLDGLTVAQRMNWAAKRTTTRPEDMAYCLMGIFDINMPLLYGEGGPRAFRRLQEQIIHSTIDESIYCWVDPQPRTYRGLLAEHPSWFDHKNCRHSRRPEYMSRRTRNVTTVCGDGLQLRLLRTPSPLGLTQDIYLVVLACDIINPEDDLAKPTSPALLLQRTSSWDDSEFVRIRCELALTAGQDRVHYPPEAGVPESLVPFEEPCLHQIYVPQGKPYIQQPKGFLFDGLSYFTSEPLPASKPLTGVDELCFSDAPNYENTWHRPVVFGGLRLPPAVGIQFHLRSLCLVFGMSPLPESGLGTRPFYREAWVAFEETDDFLAGDFEQVQTPEGRAKNNRVAAPATVKLELDSRASRIYYKVCYSLDLQSTWSSRADQHKHGLHGAAVPRNLHGAPFV